MLDADRADFLASAARPASPKRFRSDDAADKVDGAGVITVSVGGLNKSGLVGDEWSFENAQNKPVLYRAETVVYYVGVGAGLNADGTKAPSLWRARAIAKGGKVEFEKPSVSWGCSHACVRAERVLLAACAGRPWPRARRVA